ncbi:MAG: NAD-dependent epimerase/dehydratase family protein [Gemmatimonadota bacterium]
MRAVVTGGAGFIGSHLIEALVARGDDVVCLERPGASRGWIAETRVQWEPVGIERVGRLRRVFHGADVVYHLAGLTEARRPEELYAVNTVGTARVLEAAASANGRAPRVILLSSLAAVGPCRDGASLSPDTVPFPLSHYGNSKLLAEAVVHAYADRVPASIVRLPSVYGPRERAILTLFRMVRRGLALTVGGWDREVSLIYVEDVVQGLVAVAVSERSIGRTYHLAHPRPVTWARFAEAAGEAVGRRPRLVSVPPAVARPIAAACELLAKMRRRAAILNRDRVREISQARWVSDPRRAMMEIGFAPRFPIERGVMETAAWYREMNWL